MGADSAIGLEMESPPVSSTQLPTSFSFPSTFDSLEFRGGATAFLSGTAGVGTKKSPFRTGNVY